MKISEVMTPEPACCEIEDNAQKAAIIMRELNVGIVPVVETEESRKLVGLVTDRDLCVMVVAEGTDPKGVTMADCMTTELVTCHPDDEVEKVLQLMQENQVRRIPVIDAENRIEGIVSMADMVLIGELDSEEIDETIRDISEPNFEEFEHLSHLASKDGNDLTNIMPPPGAADIQTNK